MCIFRTKSKEWPTKMKLKISCAICRKGEANGPTAGRTLNSLYIHICMYDAHYIHVHTLSVVMGVCVWVWISSGSMHRQVLG